MKFARAHIIAPGLLLLAAVQSCGQAARPLKAEWTPLHLAILHHDLKKAAQLIASGADVNGTSKGDPRNLDFEIPNMDQRLTPLHVAAEQGDFQAVHMLINAHARLNPRDWTGKTPLIYAAEKGPDASALLLIKSGADVRAGDGLGDTALHLTKSLLVAKALLAKGADVNKRGYDKHTPLHVAQSLEIAKLLVGDGANLNAIDGEGQTPLQGALERELPDVALFLIHQGAAIQGVDKRGNSALHLAASNSYTAVAKALLAKGAKVNAKNAESETPLSLALQNGRDFAEEKAEEAISHEMASDSKSRDPSNIVSLLVDKGADVNLRVGERQDTALIKASMFGDQVPIVDLLLKHGAVVNAADTLGYTAVHWAACNLHPNVMRFLLQHGANVNARDKDGKTPLDIALAVAKDAIGDRNLSIRLLEAAGGKK